jgi:tRNA 2-thiouridine synthesizing protein A
MTEHTLDARRLLCPLPVIRVQDCVAGLAAGDTLEVTCTDPGVRYDIPSWCRVNGHHVMETREHEGEIIIVIQVGNSA